MNNATANFALGHVPPRTTTKNAIDQNAKPSVFIVGKLSRLTEKAMESFALLNAKDNTNGKMKQNHVFKKEKYVNEKRSRNSSLNGTDINVRAVETLSGWANPFPLK
jgi:hypothetical protein